MKNETKHTPGPWTAHHGEKDSRIGAKIGAKTLIAIVYSETYRDRENQEANARLIASAPDLLAFVEMGLEKGWFTSTCSGPSPEEIKQCPKCQAMNAIAKAQG